MAMTTIYFVVVLFAMRSDASLTLLAAHHMLFEVTLMMNFVTVSVYWSSMHSDSLLETQGDMLKIINCYWAHMGPGFSVFMNFALSDIVLRPSHVKALPLVAIAYAYNDYLCVTANGKPSYWFMDWVDWQTPALYALFTSVFLMVYLGMCHVSVQLKRNPLALHRRQQKIDKLLDEVIEIDQKNRGRPQKKRK
jgi:hypothetical protein